MCSSRQFTQAKIVKCFLIKSKIKFWPQTSFFCCIVFFLSVKMGGESLLHFHIPHPTVASGEPSPSAAGWWQAPTFSSLSTLMSCFPWHSHSTSCDKWSVGITFPDMLMVQDKHKCSCRAELTDSSVSSRIFVLQWGQVCRNRSAPPPNPFFGGG